MMIGSSNNRSSAPRATPPKTHAAKASRTNVRSPGTRIRHPFPKCVESAFVGFIGHGRANEVRRNGKQRLTGITRRDFADCPDRADSGPEWPNQRRQSHGDRPDYQVQQAAKAKEVPKSIAPRAEHHE